MLHRIHKLPLATRTRIAWWVVIVVAALLVVIAILSGLPKLPAQSGNEESLSEAIQDILNQKDNSPN